MRVRLEQVLAGEVRELRESNRRSERSELIGRRAATPCNMRGKATGVLLARQTLDPTDILAIG